MARATNSDAPERNQRDRGSAKSRGSQRADRLKDEVYREMYRLEAHHTGAEMALALAVLRAWVQGGCRKQCANLAPWLKKISPICLEMIETALSAYPAGTMLKPPSASAPCGEIASTPQNSCSRATLKRSNKP